MANYSYSSFLKAPQGISIDHIDIDSRLILDPLDKIVQFQKKSLLDVELPNDVTLMTLRIPSYDKKKIVLYCLIPTNWQDNRILFHCHGGGFLLPVHPTCFHIAYQYAHLNHCMVVLPDYRTAIHHPYPISLMDCVASYHYMDQTFNLSNSIISGDSAGGCLAISLNRNLYANNSLKSKANLLLYPVTDNSQHYASIEQYKRAEVWNSNCNQAMWKIYCDTASIDEFTIPMQIDNMKHFNPTYIEVCEMDILKDQGIAFYNKCSACNEKITLSRIPGAYHAFDSDTNNPFVKTILLNRSQWLEQNFNNH